MMGSKKGYLLLLGSKEFVFEWFGKTCNNQQHLNQGTV